MTEHSPEVMREASATQPFFQPFSHVVAVVSSKGGAGKTTLSHALASAMRDLQTATGDVGNAAYVLTDSRMLLENDNRWYDVLDGRNPSNLSNYVAITRAKTELGLLVIDGAGGNDDADEWYARSENPLADLALIPMTPDEESMCCAALYALKFPNAYVVPNRWSTNTHAARVDQDYIDILAEQIGAHRILPPLPAVHALSEFVRSDFAGEVLPTARAFARNFATVVLRTLEAIKKTKEAA